jgi:hypothetical protein
MNKIISFSEYKEMYIVPSQKNNDPEDFYDNDNIPDWDFYINIEIPNPNPNETHSIKHINIDDINDSSTENNLIEPILLSLYLNPCIKLLLPIAILFFLL